MSANMREIGIFVCNFNKAAMVVKCVKHILKQNCRNFDIYVVDNASTDESVSRLRETYGEAVTILENKENLGGSGGFGRGIREAIARGYKYFMLLDNDAFMEENVVAELYEYMENHHDVGICGAKTAYWIEPDKIQDFGGRIDYENFHWGGVFGGSKDLKGDVVLECDYVASCCLMARGEAVKVFGGFREENFIYWDDIEWCTKCRRAGYKVVVNGRAKALHDMSGASVRNMFLKYYANRNRCAFFSRYLPEEQIEIFYQSITKTFYTEIYGCLAKCKYGTAQTLLNAWEDFINGITGKAEKRIVPYVVGTDKLAERLHSLDSVLIYLKNNDAISQGVLASILPYILQCNSEISVKVTLKPTKEEINRHSLILQPCEHVTKIKDNVLPIVYVDRWKNAVIDEADYKYFSDFDNALALFRQKYRPLFNKRVKELRGL